MPTVEPLVMLDSTGDGEYPASYRFAGHAGTFVATLPAEVQPLLAELEAATQQGLHAVGFLAYEAASAINPVLPAVPPVPGLPLAWFALFRERHQVPAASGAQEGIAPKLQPGLGASDYANAVADIRRLIAAGDCYQINYTFPLSGVADCDPVAFYRHLLAAQRPSFGAFLDTGRFAVLSASPELFFARRGAKIVTRPMKGTAPRGRFPAEDREQIERLCHSQKEQAENLMIVDLLRNDLGMIAETGSVEVRELFACESYPTLHQLTSTVTARLRDDVGLSELLAALFPCGSVTGAPKRRAMEHIASLEGGARGVYCGAIGHLGPGGEATFSVAIRTLLLDRQTDTATMGVGSGITWDAEPLAEYAECLTKGKFLTSAPAPGLIESLRLENGCYHRLERHLARMAWSAGRLGHPFMAATARDLLLAHAAVVSGTRKVRLLLSSHGELSVASQQLEDNDSRPLRLAIAEEAVDPADPLLYLKTDRRERFERARQQRPDVDELLFCNLRGELTEGTYHSLVLRFGDRLVTPPLSAGLLPGTLREELLEQGKISEQTIIVEDLHAADDIWLINSVRGWRRAIIA
ncbi:aminodeoxychorismate synthase component I [Citrifermentans pelophilum]|nr:aminodeoxychorismate synthase component I [Geoanaerobacter pelophilus]